MDNLQAISRNLGLSLETTRYWFQNARSSAKKSRPDGVDDINCRPEASAAPALPSAQNLPQQLPHPQSQGSQQLTQPVED